ncbi:electron transfer flavoprotein subunit beta/FixA family protein [Serratia sp. L9]|uniref:electron transfer flavoprotein subunit beta/FixA family protein n=1 Tax=Serratia sp. L9 TaxID=3423946 RepID=UPI003D66856D
MNLLLAIKVAPDLGMLAQSDWQPDEQLQIDTSFARRLLSGYDECAAEMVLMLREKMELSLSVLTVADAMAEPVLKQLLALEYQQAVRIELPADWDLRFNPAAIAALTAAYQEKVGAQSVIVMGAQSIEGQSGQTPLMLAERLGWPCLTGVCQLAPAAEAGALQVTRQSAYGLEVMIVKPPLVLVVGNSQQASALRVPTLKQKLAAGRRQIQRLSPADLGVTMLPPGNLRLCDLTPMEHRRAGVLIEGDTVAQKVQRLCQDYLSERWSS